MLKNHLLPTVIIGFMYFTGQKKLLSGELSGELTRNLFDNKKKEFLFINFRQQKNVYRGNFINFAK